MREIWTAEWNIARGCSGRRSSRNRHLGVSIASLPLFSHFMSTPLQHIEISQQFRPVIAELDARASRQVSIAICYGNEAFKMSRRARYYYDRYSHSLRRLLEAFLKPRSSARSLSLKDAVSVQSSFETNHGVKIAPDSRREQTVGLVAVESCILLLYKGTHSNILL